MGIELWLLWWMWQPQAPGLAGVYAQEYARRVELHGEKSREAGEAARDWGEFLLRNQLPGAGEALGKAYAALGDEATKELWAGTMRGTELWEELTKAEDRGRAARAMARLGEMTGRCEWWEAAVGKEETIARWNGLGLCFREKGENGKAVKVFRRALSLDKTGKDPETAATLNNLASALLAEGELVEAEALQRRARRMLVGALGVGHVRTALATSNLADIVLARGRKGEARGFYREAWEVFRVKLGEEHEWTREAARALAAR